MRNGTLIFTVLLAGLVAALLHVQHKASRIEGMEDKEIVLRLWNIPESGSHLTRTRAERAVHDAFMRRFPQYGARSSTGIKLIGPASESNFLLAMAGNTAPDLYESNFRSISTFIQQNFCFPLEYIPDFVEWKGKVHHWEDPLDGAKFYSADVVDTLPPTGP